MCTSQCSSEKQNQCVIYLLSIYCLSTCISIYQLSIYHLERERDLLEDTDIDIMRNWLTRLWRPRSSITSYNLVNQDTWYGFSLSVTA